MQKSLYHWFGQMESPYMQWSGWRMALVVSVPFLGVPGSSSVMVVISGVSRVECWGLLLG